MAARTTVKTAVRRTAGDGRSRRGRLPRRRLGEGLGLARRSLDEGLGLYDGLSARGEGADSVAGRPYSPRGMARPCDGSVAGSAAIAIVAAVCRDVTTAFGCGAELRSPRPGSCGRDRSSGCVGPRAARQVDVRGHSAPRGPIGSADGQALSARVRLLRRFGRQATLPTDVESWPLDRVNAPERMTGTFRWQPRRDLRAAMMDRDVRRQCPRRGWEQRPCRAAPRSR